MDMGFLFTDKSGAQLYVGDREWEYMFALARQSGWEPDDEARYKTLRFLSGGQSCAFEARDYDTFSSALDRAIPRVVHEVTPPEDREIPFSIPDSSPSVGVGTAHDHPELHLGRKKLEDVRNLLERRQEVKLRRVRYHEDEFL